MLYTLCICRGTHDVCVVQVDRADLDPRLDAPTGCWLLRCSCCLPVEGSTTRCACEDGMFKILDGVAGQYGVRVRLDAQAAVGV